MELNKKKLTERLFKNSPDKWKVMGFAPLPTRLLFDENLSKETLIVFWVLMVHLFKGKEYCFPSLNTISQEAKCCKNTTIKSIKKLEELGYLQVDRGGGGGTQNKYYLKIYD